MVALLCALLAVETARASDDGDLLDPRAIRRAREAAAEHVRPSGPPVVNPRSPAPDLLSDPRVIYRTRAFEEEPWRSEVLASRRALEWIDDPVKGRALRVTWRQGGELALNWTYPFWPEAVEAILQYDILFEEDWQPADGGKLVGWSSATRPDDSPARLWPASPKGTEGTLLAGNGGARVHGDDGWSLRGSFRQPLPTWQPNGGATWVGTYAYHAGMPGRFGDAWWWDQYGQGPLAPGKWHTIRQRLRVNTPGLRDGVLEVWVDGLPAFRKADLYLRGRGPYRLAQPPYNVATSLAIRRVWLNLYHGGTEKIPQDMHVRLANFAVVRVE
jgi:hypothetical protein